MGAASMSRETIGAYLWLSLKNRLKRTRATKGENLCGGHICTALCQSLFPLKNKNVNKYLMVDINILININKNLVNH